jgi:hypothetical protein
MVDSDHSMSLSVVTRRQLLSGATSLALPAAMRPASVTSEGNDHAGQGDVVEAWRAWRRAHARTLRLCQRQQHLEARLLATIGYPRVTLPERGGQGPHAAFSIADIESFFDDDSVACRQARAEFLSHQARWDRGVAESCYLNVLQQEAASEQLEKEIAERLFATPASTLSGLLAKLDVMLREAPQGREDDEFPWPQLRAVAKDVIRLSART